MKKDSHLTDSSIRQLQALAANGKIHSFVEIKKESIRNLFTGKPIQNNDLVNKKKFNKDDTVIVFNDNNFIGIYKVINEKEIYAKPEFVMQPIK